MPKPDQNQTDEKPLEADIVPKNPEATDEKNESDGDNQNGGDVDPKQAA